MVLRFVWSITFNVSRIMCLASYSQVFPLPILRDSKVHINTIYSDNELFNIETLVNN